jgi:hypothetical protein
MTPQRCLHIFPGFKPVNMLILPNKGELKMQIKLMWLISWPENRERILNYPGGFRLSYSIHFWSSGRESQKNEWESCENGRIARRNALMMPQNWETEFCQHCSEHGNEFSPRGSWKECGECTDTLVLAQWDC